MKAIQIFCNGIELDFQHETLNVKRENNAFIQDFKVSYASYPFLVLENKNTLNALGPREISSLGKKKVVDVVVLEGGLRYSGKLCILNYLKGFRKCDLKYGSAALDILEKKLADILPAVSASGDPTPEPYATESASPVEGSTAFPAFALAKANKIFPEVDFTFPMMSWKDKFGESLETTDEWFAYFGYVNRFDGDGYFVNNTYEIAGGTINVSNRNVPSPQLYALGILKLAFESIGWKIAGNFTEHVLARRILVYSQADNLCQVNIGPTGTDYTFGNFDNEGLYFFWRYRAYFTPTQAGDYKITYAASEPLRTGGSTAAGMKTYFSIVQDGAQVMLYRNYNNPDLLFFTGEYLFSVTDDQVGDQIMLEWGLWGAASDEVPNSLNATVRMQGKNVYQMHPTVELGRYAPDTTLVNFINELKKRFFLDVLFDDIAKVATFNFSKDILVSGNKFICAKKMDFQDPAPPSVLGVMLKGPEGENFIYVGTDGTTENQEMDGDYIETIESNFFIMPHNGQTADLQKAEEKEGIGLMLFDPNEAAEDFQFPFTVADFNGYDLEITGPRGTYHTFGSEVVHFKLNASELTAEGPFTEQEIRQLQRLQKIHFNNQEFIILATEIKPTLQANNLVKFTLLSVNF